VWTPGRNNAFHIFTLLRPFLLMTDSDYILSGFREMTRSDVQGGSATYAGVAFDCTVGVFDLENPLFAAGGGHSPRLLGTLEIADEDMPEGMEPIATGRPIDVTDGMGRLRHCKVVSWSTVGPLWQITVADLDQGA
jgi:hypothetical protein